MFEDLQCGHFVGGRQNSVFFEETNSHAQCVECNTFKGGNLEKYRPKMISKYGIEEVERLDTLRHTPRKIYPAEFEELRFKFEAKFSLIKSEN